MRDNVFTVIMKNYFKQFYNTLNKGEVPVKQKIYNGTAGLSDFFFSNLIAGVMMIFFTDYVGLANNSTYGTAFLVFGLWNMINDPILHIFQIKKSLIP